MLAVTFSSFFASVYPPSFLDTFTYKIYFKTSKWPPPPPPTQKSTTTKPHSFSSDDFSTKLNETPLIHPLKKACVKSPVQSCKTACVAIHRDSALTRHMAQDKTLDSQVINNNCIFIICRQLASSVLNNPNFWTFAIKPQLFHKHLNNDIWQ